MRCAQSLRNVYVETSDLMKSTMVERIHCNYYMDERIHGKDEVSGSSPDRGSIIAFRNICFTSQLRLFEAGVFY